MNAITVGQIAARYDGLIRVEDMGGFHVVLPAETIDEHYGSRSVIKKKKKKEEDDTLLVLTVF